MPAPIRRVDELGFPRPGTFDDPNDLRARRTWGQTFFRFRWWLLVLLLPILFGETAVAALRQYLARQFVQAALEERRHDELAQALASANRALFWEPDQFEKWQGYKARAQAYEDMQGQWQESFDDWSEVIKRLDNPVHSKPQFAVPLREAYTHRAWVAERLGRHRQAIADSNTALNLGGDESERALLLNQRAYIRALANTELTQALDDVDRSLQIRSDEPEVIDTRAYVLYRLGKYDWALKEINDAINQWSRVMGSVPWQRGGGGPQVWIQEDDDYSAQDYRIYRESLAVMYHHRAEIRKKLGQQAESDEDMRRAETYGYDQARDGS
jgi:tetratricopeptide (TPR) repeat protein